jgi:two-component system, OmpR family, response regulator MprA
VAALLRRSLTFEGYEAELVSDGLAALEAYERRPHNLLVLDIMLPRLNGFDTAQQIRAIEKRHGFEPVPILMLTARDGVGDRVKGLDVGADDYLVKPFSLDELMARLRALRRRSGTDAPASLNRLEYGDLTVDLPGRKAFRGDRPLTLTPKEFDLLVYFAQNANIVLTRSQIMEKFWGLDRWDDANVLEVFVANLRKELERDDESRNIQTVRGTGYVLRMVDSG